MPDWDCPAGDYTASGATETETAKSLADHLLKAHCKAPLPTFDPSSIDLGQIDDVNVQAKVKGPVDAEVRAKGR